jgi:predicted nucleic acid-binding protein
MSEPTLLHVAEPASHFARRPRLVVDANLLAAVVFTEEAAPQAAALLRGRSLCAPAIVGLELANAAMNKVRRGAIGPEDAASALGEAERLDIECFEVGPREAFTLAARYGLSAYDAAYLWLAARLDAPLATFDARLGEAARRHLSGGAAGRPDR